MNPPTDLAIEELRQKGKDCYRRKDYQCALKYFKEAFALNPSPAMRFNIASTQDKLGLKTQSIFNYRSYLKEEGERISSKILLYIERRMKKLFSNMGRLELTFEPPGVELIIDGDLLTLGESNQNIVFHEIVLDPGEHRLAVTKNGFEAKVIVVSIKPDEKKLLHVVLKKILDKISVPLVMASPPKPNIVKPVRKTIEVQTKPKEVSPLKREYDNPMLQPISPFYLPVEIGALSSHVSLNLMYAQDGVYILGIDGQWSWWDRLEVGISLPILNHGWIVSPNMQSQEKTYMGNLILDLKVKLLGNSKGSYAVSIYGNTQFPTMTTKILNHFILALCTGIAATYRFEMMTFGIDTGPGVEIKEKQNTTLHFLNLYIGVQPHKFIAFQFITKMGFVLHPDIYFAGSSSKTSVSISPAIIFFPIPKLHIDLGASIALGDSGKFFTLGASAAFITGIGYRF